MPAKEYGKLKERWMFCGAVKGPLFLYLLKIRELLNFIFHFQVVGVVEFTRQRIHLLADQLFR
jgi:hypothetical protein